MTPTNEPAPLATTPQPGRIVRAGQSLAHGFRQMVGAQAVPTPRVDAELVRLPVIERSAEVVRYTLWRTEYWLSPGGTLRAVLRLSLKLALLIGLPALAGLGKIISKRVTLPVLGCVRIERTREGHIELTGTDLDRSATMRFDSLQQGEPTTILVPLEDLANLAKSAGRDDSLALTRIEKDKASIRFPVAGQVLEHQCESIPALEFPAIEEVTGAPIALDANLRQSLHDALACASTDPTRLILNGACLDVSKPGAHYIVGTNGSHLFSANSFALSLKETLVVPNHPFIGWRGFNEDGEWALRVRPAAKDRLPAMELASHPWRYVCRPLDGNYPNWRQVVPDGNGITATIDIAPEGVEAVLQTVTRLPDHDALNHTIGIEVKLGRVRLLGKSAKDQPWTPIEAADAAARGADVTVFVNRIYLLKALRFGLTRIELWDARSPVRFSAGGRQMVISPIRADAAPTPAKPDPAPAPVPPAAAQTNPPPQPAEQPKEETPMPENNGNTTGAPVERAPPKPKRKNPRRLSISRSRSSKSCAGISATPSPA